MTQDHLSEAERLFRLGDYGGARGAAEAGLRGAPGDAALRRLAGLALCHGGDLAGGIVHLSAALRAAPGDLETRVALAHALAMTGAADEALTLCESRDLRLVRLRAFLLQEREDLDGAVEAYRAVVAAEPNDWEAWNNLGNALRSAGDAGAAVEALAQARLLRPAVAAIRSNLAIALAEAGRPEEALADCVEAARLDPQNPGPLLTAAALLRRLGRHHQAIAALRRAEALAPASVEIPLQTGRTWAAARRLDEAEAAYRRALALDPRQGEAWAELGIVLERGNRLDALDALLAEADAAGVEPQALAFSRALALARRGRTAEALEAARSAPPGVEPARRAALIGRLSDRLCETEAAFAAFVEMNRRMALEAGATVDPARYRQRIEAIGRLVTPEWHARWSPPAPAPIRREPAFLVGFPRSGTTLLDTLLMGHPEVAVLEEEPILQRVEDTLGSYERLPSLTASEVEELRAVYFAGLDALDVPPDRLAIDKLPLNIVGAPLIHRLFPRAPLIFAQRHPCDVVLSGFMQDFELNDAMANFLTLEDGARLYAAILRFWTRCGDVLPLRTHTVIYERLVADPEVELRPLVAFLGLAWEDRLLDHRRTAAERGTIITPSYSQVTQPLYRRAAGRWERYRQQMEPVLPILGPWAERLGYGPITA